MSEYTSFADDPQLYPERHLRTVKAGPPLGRLLTSHLIRMKKGNDKSAWTRSGVLHNITGLFEPEQPIDVHFMEARHSHHLPIVDFLTAHYRTPQDNRLQYFVTLEKPKAGLTRRRHLSVAADYWVSEDTLGIGLGFKGDYVSEESYALTNAIVQSLAPDLYADPTRQTNAPDLEVNASLGSMDTIFVTASLANLGNFDIRTGIQ